MHRAAASSSTRSMSRRSVSGNHKSMRRGLKRLALSVIAVSPLIAFEARGDMLTWKGLSWGMYLDGWSDGNGARDWDDIHHTAVFDGDGATFVPIIDSVEVDEIYFQNGAYQLTGGGTLTLYSGHINISNGISATLDVPLDVGAGSLLVDGGGTLTLTNTATYTTPTYVFNSTLSTTADNGVAYGDLTLESATWETNARSNTLASLYLSSGTVNNLSSLTLYGDLVVNGSSTINTDSNGGTITLNGFANIETDEFAPDVTFTGPGDFNKNGGGLLGIVRPMEIPGNVNIYSGTLQSRVDNAIPANSFVIVQGTWDLNYTTDTVSQILVAGGTVINVGNLTAGAVDVDQGSIHIPAGGSLHASSMTLGPNMDNDGVVESEGDITIDNALVIGAGGRGTLHVTGGGITANDLSIASYGSSVSTFTLDAASYSGPVTMGNGIARIELNAGSSLDAPVLNSYSSFNELVVESGASLHVASLNQVQGSRIIMNGGSATFDQITSGFAFLKLNSGNVTTTAYTMQIDPDEDASSFYDFDVYVSPTSALNINDGSLVIAPRNYASLTVDGIVRTIGSGDVIVADGLSAGGKLTVGPSGYLSAVDSLTIAKQGIGTVVVQGTIESHGITFGKTGEASVFLDGGTIASSSDITLAQSSVSRATVRVDAGTLSAADNLIIGGAGNATLSVTSGGYVSATNIMVDVGAGSAGTLALSSGVVSSTQLIVGNDGSGTLLVSGGTLSTTVANFAANQNTRAFANITAGDVIAMGGLQLGSVGITTFNQSGGLVQTPEHIIMSGTSATANISGGILSAGRSITIGGAGNATLNLSGTGLVYAESVLVDAAVASGTLNVSGGTLDTASGMTVGVNGNGTLLQSGGRIHVGSDLIVGDQFVVSALARMTGGTLVTNGKLKIGLGAGTTQFQLNGGTLQVADSIEVTSGTFSIDSTSSAPTLSATHAPGATLQNLGGVVEVNAPSGFNFNRDLEMDGTLSLNSTGAIGVNALSLSDSATLRLTIDLDGAGSASMIDADSTVNLSGAIDSGTVVNGPTVEFQLLNTDQFSQPVTVKIINRKEANAGGGYFAGLLENVEYTQSGYRFSVDYHGGGDQNDVYITFSSVPEPTSCVLLSIGLLRLSQRRRRTA